jgi:ubiquitin carboxyl-terminal hydrolase L3
MASITTSATTNNNSTKSTNNDDKGQHQKWFPLESNPTLMNQYISNLGWDTSQYHIVDVYSTDDWALEMIPQPVVAVLLLYPLTTVQLQHEQQERDEIIKANRTNDDDDNTTNQSPVWFMKQRIGNACGTIGLLHAMMNVATNVADKTRPVIQPHSWLHTFAQATNVEQTTDPIRRAEYLERDTTIATLHDAATSSHDNQTERGAIDDDIITHFIAFVSSGSTSSTPLLVPSLYELDGRKMQPIQHMASSTNLLVDACTIIREQFMARDPEELRFTILALAPNREDSE